MTIEADLFNAVQTLVAGRVYPDLAPDAVVVPYVVYQQIGGESVSFLERAVPDKKNGRFQVAVWSTSRAEASALSLQIEAALVASTAFDAKPIGDRTAVYDRDAALRGTRQDFSIWSAR